MDILKILQQSNDFLTQKIDSNDERYDYVTMLQKTEDAMMEAMMEVVNEK